MYKLYFENASGEHRLVKENLIEEAIIPAIYSYINLINPNYKVYYINSHMEENKIWYDVGSHSEFFFAIPQEE